MDSNTTYNLQNYPGVLQIGQVERFRFCSRNDLSTILIFAFDDADIDPKSASVAFNKQFFKSSLQAFRKKQDHGSTPVVIEAYFSNVVECNKLLAEHEIYMNNEDHIPVKAKVYAPVSINPPRYIAYAIYDLPLDAGFKTHKDIKDAIIDHIIFRNGVLTFMKQRGVLIVEVENEQVRFPSIYKRQKTQQLFQLCDGKSIFCYIISERNIPTMLPIGAIVADKKQNIMMGFLNVNRESIPWCNGSWNLVERSYVLRNAQENSNRVTLTGTRNQVCAELYLPVPKEPLYRVYCLHGLPLDSPQSAYRIVKDAIIKWIKNHIKVNGGTREKPRDYLVDILLGSDGHRLMHSADEESYYNGTMCIILKNTSVIRDDSENNRKLHLYSGEYLLTASNYHYLYCRHCYRIDVHGATDCPEYIKSFAEVIKDNIP
ncbi:hypothetical protein BJV82DRAFT_687388 [Fennellomyces sp. T-0311]|nr:hypothetical protein BJV82DRAFT_687388 [Fennellomyces sp. T-0311]